MGVAFFSGRWAMRAGKLATHILPCWLTGSGSPLCLCISLSQNARLLISDAIILSGRRQTNRFAPADMRFAHQSFCLPSHCGGSHLRLHCVHFSAVGAAFDKVPTLQPQISSLRKQRRIGALWQEKHLIIAVIAKMGILLFRHLTEII